MAETGCPGKPEKRFSSDICKKGGFPGSDGNAVAEDLCAGEALKDLPREIQRSNGAASCDDDHIRFPQA